MSVAYWFRRDLRLNDNEALNAACSAGAVWPVCLIDSRAFEDLEGIRQHSLIAGLAALDDSLRQHSIEAGLGVLLAEGAQDLAKRFALEARQLGAAEVFAARAFDPQGIAEQNSVGLALQAEGIFLKLVGSNYAVQPGTVVKGDGTPYRVYTPFFKAWMEQLDARPSALPTSATFVNRFGGRLPAPTKESHFKVIAGEAYAARTFARFRTRALNDYDNLRDRADLSGTSHLSHALAFGEVHPRTLLAALGDTAGEAVFRKEIAWREFYADVLWHNQHTVNEYYDARYAAMEYDTGQQADERLAAWQQGKTGYPMVDAGMRQLLATGWMHNRVRMIVASFLVKDLHIEWQHGAEWFERHLSDFDPASNSHGWQWTAGCGTDASPYFRVFNPISQGLKFDPNGDYVRKYVPELRHIAGAAVHEPWNLLDGGTHGYPAPIVDHAAERAEALARLAALKK